MPFTLAYRWWKRDRPESLVEEYLEGQDRLWVTLLRFVSRWEGEFIVPLEPDSLTLTLDDLPIVFDRIPCWLNALALGDGEADLMFASQGTELTLTATRARGAIAVGARSLAPHARPVNGDGKTGSPVVSVGRLDA